MTASVNGIIYAIGGKNSNGTLARVETYDPSTTSLFPWRSRAALPESRAHANGATVIDGKIHVPGGYMLSNDQRVAKATLYVYDPATNSRSQRAPMPREAYGGVSVAINWGPWTPHSIAMIPRPMSGPRGPTRPRSSCRRRPGSSAASYTWPAVSRAAIRRSPG